MKFNPEKIALLLSGILTAGGISFGVYKSVQDDKKKKAEKAKFEAYKASNFDRDECYSLINNASFRNDILDPEDRAHARTILEGFKRDLENANSIKSFDEARDNLLRMCDEFTYGDKESATAQVKYYWGQREARINDAVRTAEAARQERMRHDELHYEQQKYDTVANAFLKAVETLTVKES